jgi:hypothetical protein
MKNLTSTIVLAVLCIFFFENCTKSQLFSTNNSSSSGVDSESGGAGNNQGYDGKLYAHELSVGECGDGSKVDLKIGFQTSKAILLRANCTNLKPIDQKEVSVVVDQIDKSSIIYNGVAMNIVQPLSCFSPNPAVAVMPLIDMQSSAFSGAGDQWLNLGSGGSAYDFARGVASDPTDYPPFVAASPAHFLFRGTDHLYMSGPATQFINSLHRKGAVFTIVYEGYVSNGKVATAVVNGSWSNSSGIALFYSAGQIFFQVGNGDGNSSYICTDFNSYCVGGPTFSSPADPANLFGAVSVNEAQGTGFLQANEQILSLPIVYKKDGTASAAHELDIGGVWEDKPALNSRVYRMRIWDTSLSDSQLRALYNQSSSYCPW